jgi:hypothetical protein
MGELSHWQLNSTLLEQEEVCYEIDTANALWKNEGGRDNGRGKIVKISFIH